MRQESNLFPGAWRGPIAAFAQAILLCIVQLLLSFFPVRAWASSRTQADATASAQNATKTDGVEATVTTDGALVLERADADANPISQLAENAKIRVSKRTVEGPDGGKFRRVRAGKRIGYIAEIDIRIGSGPSGDEAAGESSGQNKKSKAKKKDAERKADPKKTAKKHPPKPREEMLFTHFVGLLLGSSEYKESISGVNSSTNLMFYGLKITGPDLILGGPIVDFNFALHYGAPSYYAPLSSTNPTGFILLTDLLFMLPFSHSQNSMIYFATGPLLAFSKFAVVNAGRSMDLTQLDLGVSLELGAGYRIGDVGLRLEGKYYIETQSYKAIQVSIQSGF